VRGQDRAGEALRFGIGIDHAGLNLYGLGRPGVGKHTRVRKTLQSEAAARPTPADWRYINNFSDPQKATALQMPAGRAVPLLSPLPGERHAGPRGHAGCAGGLPRQSQPSRITATARLDKEVR
jgi:hypothetical protein